MKENEKDIAMKKMLPKGPEKVKKDEFKAEIVQKEPEKAKIVEKPVPKTSFTKGGITYHAFDTLKGVELRWVCSKGRKRSKIVSKSGKNAVEYVKKCLVEGILPAILLILTFFGISFSAGWTDLNFNNRTANGTVYPQASYPIWIEAGADTEGDFTVVFNGTAGGTIRLEACYINSRAKLFNASNCYVAKEIVTPKLCRYATHLLWLPVRNFTSTTGGVWESRTGVGAWYRLRVLASNNSRTMNASIGQGKLGNDKKGR